jgi:transposase
MLTQSKKLNFEGQNIYVGIDVHLKSWNVTILSDQMHLKTFNQIPSPEKLSNYLNSNYPKAVYKSAYEAGFCGYWSHRRLMDLGIENIIVNPADVPTTQKETALKSDPVDSRKIARFLRSGELSELYIPQVETEGDRILLRSRYRILMDLGRIRRRIKSLLYFQGVSYPPALNASVHWSSRFMKWLSEDVHLESESAEESLGLFIKEANQLRSMLLEVNRCIKRLSQSPSYEKPLRLIRSVPGIGIITGMTLLAEIENITRFKNADRLACFVGLVPMCHSSGEKESKGELTFRGKLLLRSYLIESAWIAARIDPALQLAFSELCKRMPANNAIIRIAKKLLNRIYYVLKNKKEYELCMV